MSGLALVLGAAITIAAVVFVGLPFLREPRTDDDRLDAPSEAEAGRLELVEARDRALAALKELEFDHRTGKITDTDYRVLVGQARRAAAGALRALERSSEAGIAGQQEDVQGDDRAGHNGSDGRGRVAVDERPHHVAPGGEPDQGHERERDPERQHDL